MARYSEHDRTLVVQASCSGRSDASSATIHALSRPRDVWTAAAAEELHGRFIMGGLHDKRTFMQKWAAQLDGATDELRVFAAAARRRLQPAAGLRSPAAAPARVRGSR